MITALRKRVRLLTVCIDAELHISYTRDYTVIMVSYRIVLYVYGFNARDVITILTKQTDIKRDSSSYMRKSFYLQTVYTVEFL